MFIFIYAGSFFCFGRQEKKRNPEKKRNETQKRREEKRREHVKNSLYSSSNQETCAAAMLQVPTTAYYTHGVVLLATPIIHTELCF